MIDDVTAPQPEPVAAADGEAADPAFGPHARDWDWLAGRWTVRHRKLRARLQGSGEWDEFDGACVNWPVMGGRGNVDDNVLEQPGGTYRAVSVRAFDIETRQWAIWWLDSRYPGIGTPVRGGFANGEGTFLGDEVIDGRPIKVRFRWTAITPHSAHWAQAFSPDGGATWETNWEMAFTRMG